VVLSISASACGQCQACACVFACICMRMHMCVSLYICTFFGTECCMHFGTGALGTSVWAGVYITQVCFLHQRTHLRQTRCKLSTPVYMYICVYMHAYVYRCTCASMILLDTLMHCYWDFLSVHTCAYACICICVCMYRCMYMYICMFVYMYAYTFIYTCVWMYICTRVGTFRLILLSNLSATCACITGVS